MKKLVLLALAIVPFCAGVMVGGRTAAKLPAQFESTSCGFRMDALSLTSDAPGMIAMFMGDNTDGFAPSVTVMAQPLMPAAEYLKSTLAQSEKMGFKIARSESGKLGEHDTLSWEYGGKQQGRDLQFVARAIFLPKRVLLVTCTATPKQLAGMRETFNAVLASIELIPDKK